MRFLIDNNLTTSLTNAAHQAGHMAWHVRDRKWEKLKDPPLLDKAIENDLVIVTRNARDFRREKGKPGLCDKQEIHAGLICLVYENQLGASRQVEGFSAALRYIEGEGITDLVNKGLDCELVEEAWVFTLYDLPAKAAKAEMVAQKTRAKRTA